MYLFDTNVVSELRKEQTVDANVRAWANGVRESMMHISVITLQELEVGVLLMERRDPQQGSALRLWLENTVHSAFAERILPVTEAVALRCAQLHVPDRKPERDALIAATALVHGLTVATRNVSDFAPMGVKLVNPWQA